MHGLYQPAVSALNIHNSMMIDATPRQTSTDKIETALNALIEDGHDQGGESRRAE
jgi:hypothetical protein